MNIAKASFLFFWILLITGCASQIPPEIRQSLVNAPGVAQVHGSAESHLSQKVRWGGVILQTENKGDVSWMTIVAFPLDTRGEPLTSDQSPGRFIAIVNQFLEPLVYSADRQITVFGELLRMETVLVDEFPYQYPVVQVEQQYLWPVRNNQPYVYPGPYWYDPFYYPFHHRTNRRHHLYYNHHYY